MALLFDGCIMSVPVVVFSKATIIGITSSTCRHYTLINSIMCSDSYPIPILSFFFLYHPYYPLLFNSKNFSFSTLLSFFYCMHACTATRRPILMVGIMLYAKVSPLYNVLWECIVVVYT